MGIFNEIECKHVKELPFDIDGFYHFQLECDPSNIMKSSKDGRRWKTWCTSKRKEHRGVRRRARCGGSWKCPNEDCLFLRKKGSPNDVQFTNNEIGKKCFICEEEAIFVECKAIKAESLADSRRVQDTKAKATKSLESHGYSFDAFCEFKKFCDERHPNLLYRFNDERQNDNNTFVFKCSRFQANLAMSMDCEKIGLLHDQYCYADATHKRCPGFKTITLWVYHPLLRKLVEWKGTMESTTEDTEAMDVSGDKTYVFNPAGWVLDEAGAEWNAIKIVFGEDAMAKVVSCEFHYKQSVGRKSGKLDNKHKAEFKALAWALMEANTTQRDMMLERTFVWRRRFKVTWKGVFVLGKSVVDPRATHSPTKRGESPKVSCKGKQKTSSKTWTKQELKTIKSAKSEASEMSITRTVKIASDYAKFSVTHGKNTYDVDICHTPSCSCPDNRPRPYKHIL
ncbi:Hypothetical predicted protein [Paramuricea clavata]|uniref:Uncharacterized protein n=1 Tax=Paramuricea clavata TaxID=317549 RepID=A0A6S7I8X8_PARCT|nr:Hypothetical predicted protein [Paramuricea clavata]